MTQHRTSPVQRLARAGLPAILSIAALAALAALPGCRGSVLNPKSDLELRVDAARAIAEPVERDEALAEVVLSAADQGDGRMVLRTLPQVVDPGLRDATAAASIDRIVKYGQRADANKVAATIADPDLRNETFKRLAHSSLDRVDPAGPGSALQTMRER